MKKVLSAKFNMDSGSIEVALENGSTETINCTTIENTLETNINARTELDWLVDHDPKGYAEKVLNGTMQTYLDEVSDWWQNTMKN
jgi:hypothetical protein